LRVFTNLLEELKRCFRPLETECFLLGFWSFEESAGGGGGGGGGGGAGWGAGRRRRRRSSRSMRGEQKEEHSS